jgi:hypothetical protein
MVKSNLIASVLALVSATLSLSGCALIDEGAIDYRRAEIQDATTPAAPGDEVSPAKLVEKYQPISDEFLDAYITKDDFYQVTLKQGVIKDFEELFGQLDDGEVAVVATVFEVGDLAEDGTARTINFSPNAVQSARVIYYSGDVERGQPLNLSQLPIYGPIQYHQGNSLVIQLYGIELDQISDRTKSLIKELARLGASAATVAASPAAGQGVDVLTNLAMAFLNGNHDDVMFRYDMTLASQFQSRFVPQDYLTEGERVFVRQDDRQVPIDWSSLTLDRMSGRLLKNGQEFRDSSYMIVDVVKLRNATGALSQVSLRNLSALITDLQQADQLNEAELAALSKSIDTLVQTATAERKIETAAQQAFDPVVPRGVRKAAATSLLQDFQKSLQADAAHKVYQDADVQKGLRLIWKRVAHRDPTLAGLDDLTLEKLRTADEATIGNWAEAIAKIYDKT